MGWRRWEHSNLMRIWNGEKEVEGRRKGGKEQREGVMKGKKEERNGGKRRRGNSLTREMESRHVQGSSGQATESGLQG